LKTLINGVKLFNDKITPYVIFDDHSLLSKQNTNSKAFTKIRQYTHESVGTEMIMKEEFRQKE
jgi:hypothetical protein